MDRKRRESTPAVFQSVPAGTETISPPSSHPSPHHSCNCGAGPSTVSIIRDIMIDFNPILPIWLGIISYLHIYCYVSDVFLYFATIVTFLLAPNPWPYMLADPYFPPYILGRWLNKYGSNILSNIRAEAGSILTFFKDHTQRQRLKRAWDSFRLWYLLVVVFGLGKASQSMTLRFEGAVVICMVWALAQADRQESEELKAEIEDWKERLAASESEEWSWVGEQD